MSNVRMLTCRVVAGGGHGTCHDVQVPHYGALDSADDGKDMGRGSGMRRTRGVRNAEEE